MENVMISLRAVLPLFFCMALGFYLKQIKYVDQKSLNVMNKLCFRIFLPLYLCRSIYTTNLSEALNWVFLGVCALGMVLIFLVLMLVIPHLVKERDRCGVVIQAMFRSNYVLLGLPIATYLCGEEHLGPASLLASVVVPMVNVLGVICLEFFRGGKPSVKKMLKGIVTNPLVIGSAVGILIYLSGLQIPYVIDKTVSDLGKIASPLALTCLGGFFTFSGIRKYRKELFIGVMGKLIVVPAIMITVAALIGFRGEMLVPIMIAFGAPAAVNSFTMAQQMGGDGELAAEEVVFTSAISILTLFLWILILKNMMLI